VSNFPGKIGVHGGASVGSGNSLTTRNSYSTHCVSVFFDDVDIESEAEMNDQPPPPHLTTTPTVATMSPLTTQPSSYASAVTRNLQQQPNNEANQLRQQMDKLTVMMTTVLQRLAEIESATTMSTVTTQQPSPARIRKKISPPLTKEEHPWIWMRRRSTTIIMSPLNEDPWFPSSIPTDPLNENPWTFPTNPEEDW
jgi:hypothetical protein